MSETTRWNAALIRYLVHHWGVRVIAYESDAAGTAHWNRYLTSGDSADLEEGFEGTKGSLAETMEAEYLLESLRAIQAELPEAERLRLTGYDIAVQPGTTMLALLDYLEQVAPEEVADWIARWDYRRVPFREAAVAVEELLAQLDANRDAYVAIAGEPSWNAARIDAGNLRDGFNFLQHYAKGDFGTGNATYREPGMIRNTEELASGLGEGERLLLISHNLHCARRMPASGSRSIDESPALGTHLARSETWGPQYAMIAQVYEHGQHNVAGAPIELEDFDSIDESLAGSIETVTDAPALLIGTDSTLVPMDERIDLAPFGISRKMGVPADQYDAVLWVRDVSATDIR